MPPEYIDNQIITSKFDVFSLGVVILQIVAGRTGCSQRVDMPSEEFIELVRKINSCTINKHMFSHILPMLCFNLTGAWKLGETAADIKFVGCITRSQDMHQNSVKMCG
jgi:serine/threonine protein kinase